MADEPKRITFDTRDWEAAHLDFMLVYGLAMSKWAKIERGLYYWFAGITRMKGPMSRAIFYGAKGFAARADMLEAAIEYAELPTPEEIEFIKKAVKKAQGYSGFRNSIAHGEPLPHIHERASGTTIKVDMTQAKNLNAQKITVADMNAAIENFDRLGSLLINAHPRHRNGKSIAELLSQVLALPNQANSKSGPNPSTPESQPQGEGRVNKKAYRAAQQTKRPKDG